jgi:hypothetical protein
LLIILIICLYIVVLYGDNAKLVLPLVGMKKVSEFFGIPETDFGIFRSDSPLTVFFENEIGFRNFLSESVSESAGVSVHLGRFCAIPAHHAIPSARPISIHRRAPNRGAHWSVSCREREDTAMRGRVVSGRGCLQSRYAALWDPRVSSIPVNARPSMAGVWTSRSPLWHPGHVRVLIGNRTGLASPSLSSYSRDRHRSRDRFGRETESGGDCPSRPPAVGSLPHPRHVPGLLPECIAETLGRRSCPQEREGGRGAWEIARQRPGAPR